MAKKARTPIILCATEMGRAIIFGFVDDLPEPGKPVMLYDARMVLKWSETCGGLFGLAAYGPKPGCKVTHAVSRMMETVWKEFLVVSPPSATLFKKWTP